MSTRTDFANADTDEVVAQLTVEEATKLITGVGWWRTAEIPRLGVPSIKVSDGPNGLRGERFFNSSKALCIPCPTALASTWDTSLIRELGSTILAPEVKARGASVILAPTVNIQRSPLGGRSFESYSEDPVLNGTMAANYIDSIQREGVACTIKHFVCNDQENARHGSDSIVSARALREVYLMPFMIAQRDAKPWAYMTAYNRLNGLHCSEHPWLLQTLLRDEWKSDALVMSDWFGVYSVDLSIKAGVDLEMPGERGLRYSNSIERAMVSYKLSLDDIKARARNVLQLVQRVAKSNKAVVYGDGQERDAQCSQAQRDLLRRAAAQSIVLLRNAGGLLPLDSSKLQRVAVIGPNAKQRIIYGGGSAQITPLYTVSPFEGIVNAFGAEKVTYAEGIRAYKLLPVLDHDLLTPDGQPGWRLEFYPHSPTDVDEPLLKDEPAVVMDNICETSVHLNDTKFSSLTPRWTLKLRGYLAPRDYDGEFEFGLGVIGRAKLYFDGQLVIDNWDEQVKGESFFGRGTTEKRARVKVVKGHKHAVEVIFNNVSPLHGYVITPSPAIRLGGDKVVDEEQEIEHAVQIAKEAEVAVVVIGLNHDWESEAYDRTTLALPGRTNELVRRVLQVNPRTVVVNQSGSAVGMPWADEVPAILQAWYAGNSAGDGLTDVLVGAINPSAKLPLTFPRAITDTPSHGHFGSRAGPVRYAEDLWVGYRHYVDRNIQPLWPFGFGLSYTTFEYTTFDIPPEQIGVTDASQISVALTISVKNTGTVTGAEVVQIYVSPPPHPLLEPLPSRVLKHFVRTPDIAPGATYTTETKLDKYAFSAWEEKKNAWVVREGTYKVAVATSSVDVRIVREVKVEKSLYWTGL